jgi:adenosylmethionine-8-amino-7-oxononanoate aminotransferase
MTSIRNISASDRAHIWHPYTQAKTAPLPVPIVKGQGVYLYTQDGKKILDGILPGGSTSMGTAIHG